MSIRDPNYYGSGKDKKSKSKHSRHHRKHRNDIGGGGGGGDATSSSSAASSTTSDEGAMGYSNDSQLYDMGGGYGSYGAPMEQQQQQQQQSDASYGTAVETQDEFPQSFLDAPAKVKWNTIVMHCSAEIKMSDLAKQLQTLGNTDIEFSLAKGNMWFEGMDNAYDLEKQSKNKYATDILQLLQLEAVHAPGLDSAQTLISTNIERFESEFWYSGDKKSSPTINRMLLTGELTHMNGQPIVLVDRTAAITNRGILWQNQHPGSRPGNLEKDYRKIDKDAFLLHTQSPILSMYLSLHPNSKREEVAGLKDRIQVSGRFIKKYAPMTQDAMKNSITYANLTTGEGLVIKFSRVIPQHRLKAHQDYVASARAGVNIVGQPYMGFAAPFEQTKVDEVLKIEFRVVGKYLRGGKPIEISAPVEQ